MPTFWRIFVRPELGNRLCRNGLGTADFLHQSVNLFEHEDGNATGDSYFDFANSYQY